MLWSIRSQAISQNQDRVRRPHVDIAKGCLDFNPLGWSRDCTDKQPLETRIHVVVDDDDDDNDGAVTFASDADHDAFAIQDASDFHLLLESLRACSTLGITLTLSTVQ